MSRLIRGALLAASLVVVLALVVPLVVIFSTQDDAHTDLDEVEPAQVALVLGAGVTASGRPTPFLARRLDTAIALYRTGTVKALLMSGDNSSPYYDEVTVMADYAIAQGVPADRVVTDHAGFDTYSSCYRARSVWGLEEVVVVSQAFHVPRAIWLCRQLGLTVNGAVAGDGGASGGSRAGWIREVPAIDKAVLDVVRRREPTFPGPPEDTFTSILN